MSESEKPNLISTEPAPPSNKKDDIALGDNYLYEKLSSSTRGSIAQAGVPIEFKENTEDEKSQEDPEKCPITKSSPGREPLDNGGNCCAEGNFDPPTSKRLVTTVSADSLHRGLKKITDEKK